MKKLKNNFGFTMIELLIVMSVIGILSSSVFLNWKHGESGFALQNSAYKLSQDIREMQEMAMEAKEIDCGGGDTCSSFGVYFNKSYINYYLLFVDCDGNKAYETVNDKLIRPAVYFEDGIEFFNLSSPATAFSVLFVPPEPTTYIKNETSDIEAVISVYDPDYPSEKKTIRLNTSGMIEIK
jgi:prepilin-type N-terminal cleavage/methylation domain-containing protein